MRDFPSCFGESGVQTVNSSAGHSANGNGSMVTCLYRTQLDHGDGQSRECRMSVVWSKTVLGEVGLSITLSSLPDHAGRHDIDDYSTIRSTMQLSLVDIKLGPPGPSAFSNSSSYFNLSSIIKSKLKWKSKGSRSIFLPSKGTHHAPTPAPQLHVFWDLSAAKFDPSPSPQPSEGFYVAVVSHYQMVLLLGDLTDEAYSISGASKPSTGPSAICVSRKQHISGNKVYTARACFCNGGRCHDISIECDMTSSSGSKQPCLEILVDRKRVIQVKKLSWKFRGNQTVVVDGAPVEVLWDVHSWLFGTRGLSAPPNSAVFMFYTAPSTDNMLETHLGFSLLLYASKVQ